MKDCRVTILVENESSSGDLVAEHGFAAWIEYGDAAVLLDVGRSRSAIFQNAERLGIDPGAAAHLVISHGHYDHTGGVPGLPAGRGAPVVWIHPEAFRNRWSVRPGEAPRDIGIPPEARAALRSLPAERMVWTDGPAEVLPGMGVTGEVPRIHAWEDAGGPFFLDPAAEIPDEVPDDQALWFHTPLGLVVCTGCAHSGIANILEYVVRTSGEKRIRAVLGGFHLRSASPERLDRTIEAFRRFQVREIYPCHCTGNAAIARFRTALPDRTFRVRSGDRIIF